MSDKERARLANLLKETEHRRNCMVAQCLTNPTYARLTDKIANLRAALT